MFKISWYILGPVELRHHVHCIGSIVSDCIGSIVPGRFGNTLDPNPADALDVGSSDSESTDVASRSLRLQLSASRDLVCESGSEPQRTSPTDAVYQHVALGADKPCLYVGAVFEDLTKRLHHVNMLKRMADSMVSHDARSSIATILNIFKYLIFNIFNIIKNI